MNKTTYVVDIVKNTTETILTTMENFIDVQDDSISNSYQMYTIPSTYLSKDNIDYLLSLVKNKDLHALFRSEEIEPSFTFEYSIEDVKNALL